jgi:ferredoxin
MSLLSLKERLKLSAYDNPDHCMMAKVAIDYEKCNGCGMCVAVCVAAALEMHGTGKEKRPRMTEGNPPCVACNDCMAICEKGAISAIKIHNFRYKYKRVLIEEPSTPRNFEDVR